MTVKASRSVKPFGLWYDPSRRGMAQCQVSPLDDALRQAIVWRMAKDQPAPKKPAIPCTKQAARQQREADALRANLRKRKDQARARDKPKQD